MIFIKSGGGNGQAALRMVNLLRAYFKKIIALIPLNCESAATMLALGADEMKMGPMAHLSAVDTSITHDMSPIDRDNDRVSVGANELARIIKQWDAKKTSRDSNPYVEIYKYIHPLVIGSVDRADSLSIKLCEEILSYHIADKNKIKRIAHSLNNDYPSHEYPIVIREAKKLGLKVSPLEGEVEKALMELNELYSEMGQRCRTDFDEHNFYTNEILNITEVLGTMVYYQREKDSHFRQSDRTWISTNEKSNWKMRALRDGSEVEEVLHIR